MSKITKYRVEIDVYYYSNVKDLRKEYKKRLRNEGFVLKSSDIRNEGFANMGNWSADKEIKTGEIHVPMPMGGEEFRLNRNKRSASFREETIGHELRHIIEGHFHSTTIFKKIKK